MVAIVSRAAWGANPLTTPASYISTPTPDLWLHHTASTGLHGASGMRSLQAGAIAGGYVDLEYSYVVDVDGVIYESRGPGRNTAATGGSSNGVPNNERSHAICTMGNFEVQAPPEIMLDAVADLVRHGAASGWWPAQITGPHRAAPGNSTACCGALLIARIPDINARALGDEPAPVPEDDDVTDLASATNHDGRPVVFQVGGDRRLYYRLRDAKGGAWSPWRDLSSGFADFATVTAYPNPNNKALEVWVTMRDGKTFQRWQLEPDFATWSAWEDRTR